MPSSTSCITMYANVDLVSEAAVITEFSVSGRFFSLSRSPYAFM